MEIKQEQASAIKECFGEKVSVVREGGNTFLHIESTRIPGGIDQQPVDLLFSPGPWGGYESRLLFSRQIQTSQSRNWNTVNVRIAEKNWHAFSWRATPGLTMLQTLLLFLEAAK